MKMANSKRPPKTEYKVVVTQLRGGNKRTKAYKARDLDHATEMYERMETYRIEEHTPYWKTSTVKIQTREVTNWRTYHHVTT